MLSSLRRLAFGAVRFNSSKIFSSASAAVSDIPSGCTLMVGGFAMGGTSYGLCPALAEKGVKDIEAIVLSFGVDGPFSKLLEAGSIKRLTSSFVGLSKMINEMYIGGDLELVLCPQGSVAERSRAGGVGIPGFYTPAGAGTYYEEGKIPVKYGKDGEVVEYSQPKEFKIFDNKRYVFETALKADYGFVHAKKVDTLGNCVFHGNSANMNPEVARASKVTIVEAEEIVEAGEIPPDMIHLPGIYVDRIIKVETEDKPIDFVVIDDGSHSGASLNEDRTRIARRCALEMGHGMTCNLGIGLPTNCPAYLDEGVEVNFQSENGAWRLGAPPKSEEAVDRDVINAGGQTSSLLTGAACFSSADSFGMIRGGHVAMTVLGALEVAQNGDLANWTVPGQAMKGMGGAMDLVSSPSKVVVTMDHCDKKGNPKIVERCSLPLTSPGCVSTIITELGVFECHPTNGLTMIEIADHTTIEEVWAKTGCKVNVSDQLIPMQQ